MSNKFLEETLAQFPALTLYTSKQHEWLAARCVECNETKKLRLGTGMPKSPELFVKGLRRIGWQIEQFQCHCPNHTPAGIRRAARMAREDERDDIINGVAVDSEPEDESEHIVHPDIKQALDHGPLNAAERFAIRRLLDEHFDDKRGVYLNEWTDEKVAQEVGAPTYHIVNLREAAYGPLSHADELEELTRRLFAANERMADMSRRIGELREEWNTAWEDMKPMLQALRRLLPGQ